MSIVLKIMARLTFDMPIKFHDRNFESTNTVLDGYDELSHIEFAYQDQEVDDYETSCAWKMSAF